MGKTPEQKMEEAIGGCIGVGCVLIFYALLVVLFVVGMGFAIRWAVH